MLVLALVSEISSMQKMSQTEALVGPARGPEEQSPLTITRNPKS